MVAKEVIKIIEEYKSVGRRISIIICLHVEKIVTLCLDWC